MIIVNDFSWDEFVEKTMIYVDWTYEFMSTRVKIVAEILAHRDCSDRSMLPSYKNLSNI